MKALKGSSKAKSGSLDAFCNNIRSGFSTFLVNARFLLANWLIVPQLVFYVASLAFSSVAFNHIPAFDAWSQSIIASKNLKENDFVQYSLQSNSLLMESSEDYSIVQQEVIAIQRNTYTSMVFIAPFFENGTPKNGNVLSIQNGSGYSIPVDITCGTIDFCDYFNETIGSQYFAACHLEPLFKDLQHLSWNGFNFDGKDGSSYIPSALADLIISLNQNDCFDDYESLIGSAITYGFEGTTVSLSINNIYDSNTEYAQAVDRSFNTPIITNCKKLYSISPRSVIGSCIEDELDIRELIYQFGLFEGDLKPFSSFFVSKNGDWISADDGVSNTINSIAENQIKYFFSRPAIVALLFISLIAFLLSSLFIGLKSKTFSSKDSLLLFLLVSLVFGFFDGIIFVGTGSTLLSYRMFNPIFGFLGLSLPLISCAFIGIGVHLQKWF